MNESQAKLFLSADAVCFDVDSTVITGEGLDDLAAYCGIGDEVKEWTNKAMGEGLSFRHSLSERLKLIELSENTKTKFIDSKPHVLTDGVKKLVGMLHHAGKDVYLVSGGFHSIIKPIADELSIDEDRIYANRFTFDDNGNLSGFDVNQPTSSSGGKKVVVENLIKEHNYKCLVSIGDGMTDFETFPPASLFIGFGGNKTRTKVLESAPCFIYSFHDLIKVMESETS